MLRLACKILIHERRTTILKPEDNPFRELSRRREEVLEINFVHNITIEQSWRDFTDIATVVLPRFIDTEKDGESKRFDVIDENFRARMLGWLQTKPDIEIYLGYETPKDLAFKGVITDIKGRVPVELVCEDHMHFLKSKLVNASYPTRIKIEESKIALKNITIRQFVESHLESILDEFNIGFKSETIIELLLGSFVFKNKTILKVFEWLKEVYGVYSFIRYLKEGEYDNGTPIYKPYLHIGTEYPALIEVEEEFFEDDFRSKGEFNFLDKPKRYLYNTNSAEQKGFFRFEDNIIEDDLVYVDYGASNVRVKYIVQGKNEGDQLVIVVPEPKEGEEDDAEEVTYKYFDPNFIFNPDAIGKGGKIPENQEEKIKENPIIVYVTRLAILKLLQIRYTGFIGSFTTFGETIYVTSEGEKVGDFIRPGDIIELREQSKQKTIADFKYERQKYLVDEVEHSFGIDGYRQTIYIGASADIILEEQLSNVRVSIFVEHSGSYTNISATIDNWAVNVQLSVDEIESINDLLKLSPIEILKKLPLEILKKIPKKFLPISPKNIVTILKFLLK